MATSFHDFARLPAELRFCIWELVVVDRTIPGANFFDIYPIEIPDIKNSREVSLMPPNCVTTRNGCDKDAMFSWEHRRSQSLADSGLWNACLESRRIMEREVKILRVRFERGVRMYDELPMTVEVTDYAAVDFQSVIRRCTFIPSKDLFVLNLSGFCDGINKYLPVVKSLTPRWLALVSSFKNVAFENYAQRPAPPRLQIANADKEPKENTGKPYRLTDIIAAASFMKPGSTVFLIDYSLQRPDTSTPADERTDRLVFQAIGGRFIEVGINDEEWIYGGPFPSGPLLQATCVCAKHLSKASVNFKVLAWKSD